MMNALRRGSLLSVALLFLASTACNTDHAVPSAPIAVAPAASVQPSSPALSGPSQSLLGGLIGGLTRTLGITANGVLRTTPLAEPITVKKTIGRAGGVLSIPEAGVTVLVPAGALDDDTEIMMTARAGSLLAYDFEPHGVTFRVPLVFNQSLRGTNAGLLSPLGLKLGYYSDPSLLGKTTAVVSELVTGVTSILTRTFTAPIKHFSGYVVLSGFSDE